MSIGQQLRSGLRGAALLAAMLVGLTAVAGAAEPAKRTVSTEARAAVEKMGKTLLAEQFSFTVRTLRVYADDNRQPLHIGHTMKVTLRRPDRLRVDVTGDDGATQLLYDGKSTVLFSPAANKYATIPAPDTVEAMMKTVVGKLGVDFPLADFLTNTPEKSFLFGVTSGREINTVTIDGTPCLHLVFDQPGVQLELWIEKNERAVPRRLIATYHSLPDRPNFVAEFSGWNFDTRPADADFAFQPPAGATPIELKPANRAAPNRQGGISR